MGFPRAGSSVTLSHVSTLPTDGRTLDVIEGRSDRRQWRRPRRLPWGIALAVLASAAGAGFALAEIRGRDELPSLAALRAVPAASSGLVRWAPRGQLADDEGFVQQALRRLRTSGLGNRPRTALHLLYAGDGIVLVEGKDRGRQPVLAQVLDDDVVVQRLRAADLPALTPVDGRTLRFLVAPPAEVDTDTVAVWVRDSTTDAANGPASLGGGFRKLEVNGTGLTADFRMTTDEARFVVEVPEWKEPGGHKSATWLGGDALAHVGRLIPTITAIRLGLSPQRFAETPAPSRQWVDDAELLTAGQRADLPVQVAALVGGVGFSPGPPREGATTYFGGLYAVTDAVGREYVGFVLRAGQRPLCQRMTPVEHSFSDLLAVGGRCAVPAESLEAILVAARTDVVRGVVAFPGATPKRQPVQFTGGTGLVVTVPAGSYPTVTVSATSEGASSTFTIPAA